MLPDDFLQHLDRLLALIRQHESRDELFARIRIVRLQLQNLEVERNRFLDLLGGREIVRYLFQHGRIIFRILDGLSEKIVDAFDILRRRFHFRLENHRGVELAQPDPETPDRRS